MARVRAVKSTSQGSCMDDGRGSWDDGGEPLRGWQVLDRSDPERHERLGVRRFGQHMSNELGIYTVITIR